MRGRSPCKGACQCRQPGTLLHECEEESPGFSRWTLSPKSSPRTALEKSSCPSSQLWAGPCVIPQIEAEEHHRPKTPMPFADPGQTGLQPASPAAGATHSPEQKGFHSGDHPCPALAAGLGWKGTPWHVATGGSLVTQVAPRR